MKLPLSTTYVTFMVAMGSSLADKAWGSDSAVYRVSGVISVVSGWFMTAIIAFTAAAILALAIYQFELFALGGLLIFAIVLIGRNYLKTRKSSMEIREELEFKKAESSSIIGIIEESSVNVSVVMKRGSKLMSRSLSALSKQDLRDLRKARDYGESLSEEIEDLKNHIFFYIKNLDGDSPGATRFYLMIQDGLQDLVQSLTFISKSSYKHVKNGHRGLRYNQIKDLEEVSLKIQDLFGSVKEIFDNQTLEMLPSVIDRKEEYAQYISDEIEKQIARTKDPESSARNTTLYFSLLLEMKDIVEALTTLMQEYYKEYELSKKPDIL